MNKLFVDHFFMLSLNSSSFKESSQEYKFTKKLRFSSQIMQFFWKIVWQFLKKLNIELPYDPAVFLM